MESQHSVLRGVGSGSVLDRSAIARHETSFFKLVELSEQLRPVTSVRLGTVRRSRGSNPALQWSTTTDQCNQLQPLEHKQRRPPSTIRTALTKLVIILGRHMHVDVSVTRRCAKRHVSVHFIKNFGEQLFLAARCAHDKMAVLPGPIRRGLARLVWIVGAWDRG